MHSIGGYLKGMATKKTTGKKIKSCQCVKCVSFNRCIDLPVPRFPSSLLLLYIFCCCCCFFFSCTSHRHFACFLSTERKSSWKLNLNKCFRQSGERGRNKLLLLLRWMLIHLHSLLFALIYLDFNRAFFAKFHETVEKKITVNCV